MDQEPLEDLPKLEHHPNHRQHEDEEDDDEDSGGFDLRGPLGFGARFPRSAATESKWIIRAIALAIPILALLYGLSFVLSFLFMWVYSYGTICPVLPRPDILHIVFSLRDLPD